MFFSEIKSLLLATAERHNDNVTDLDVLTGHIYSHGGCSQDIKRRLRLRRRAGKGQERSATKKCHPRPRLRPSTPSHSRTWMRDGTVKTDRRKLAHLKDHVGEQLSGYPGPSGRRTSGSYSKLSLKHFWTQKWPSGSCPTSGTSWESRVFCKRQ